ncbi:zinc finger, CCHC-type containing protein [Tanacetum coccineum]
MTFHGLRSEDTNQHLKDFLKLVDSLNLNVENRERMRLRLFQFSLRDQARNWLERLPTRSISTWEDLITRFLAQFFPPGMTAKIQNDILMFQQHQGESLFEAWTRYKELLQKKSLIMASIFGCKSKSFMTMLILPQDAILSKFEADFKQQQGEMTNNIDIFLKAINDQMTGALPSDTFCLLVLTRWKTPNAHPIPLI